jgi:RWD domain
MAYLSLVRLVLKVHCPPDYPDVLPDLTIAVSQGEISSAEEASLLSTLHDVVCVVISMLARGMFVLAASGVDPRARF